MPYTYGRRYLRTLKSAGNVGTTFADLAAAGSAATTTTIVSYPAGGGGGPYRRFVPGATSTANVMFQTANTAGFLEGWRQTAGQNANETIRIPAQNWEFRFRYRRSGRALELDIRILWGFKIHMISPGNLYHTLIAGPVYHQPSNATTTTQTATVTFSVGEVQIPPGFKIAIEVIAVAKNAFDQDTAPAVATDLWLVLDEAEAQEATSLLIPDYTLLMDRSPTDTIPTGVGTAIRSSTTVRSREESAPAIDVPTRNYGSVRARSEAVGGVDALARTAAVGRTRTEALNTQDTSARGTSGSRGIGESVTTNATPTRTHAGGRTASDAVFGQDTGLVRVYLSARTPTQVTSILDTVTRTNVVLRSKSEAVFGVDSIGRAIIQGRFPKDYPTGVVPDWNPDFPVRKVSGVVRDSEGAIVAGATVKLMRTLDDKMVQEQVSADGSYNFLRDLYDPYDYYVIAYLDVTPQVHGISDRGFVPEAV